MKKTKILLLGCSMFALTGCNAGFNEQIFDLNYKYDKAHLVSAGHCVSIEKWNNYENSDMVQIITKDGTVILGYATEIVLINGECPYCGRN